MRRNSFRSRSTEAGLFFGLMLLLAGCASQPRAVVAPNLPPMPSRLTIPCADPGVPAARPFVLTTALTRQELGRCEGKRRDAVAFYEDLRRRLAK